MEDEEISRRALEALLSLSGYATQAVPSAEKALQAMADGLKPVIALVDVDLPGMDGMELIERLEAADPSIHTVLVTAAEMDRIEPFSRSHVVKYINKPVEFEHLLRMIGDQPDC